MMNDWNRVSVYFFYLLTHGHRQFNGLATKNPKRNQNSKFQVTPVLDFLSDILNIIYLLR